MRVHVEVFACGQVGHLIQRHHFSGGGPAQQFQDRIASGNRYVTDIATCSDPACVDYAGEGAVPADVHLVENPRVSLPLLDALIRRP